MVDESTTNKHYPLPHPSNIESQDVTRIATAISMIDSDVTSCLNSVETMNSVVSGLETKALKIPNELVGQVDTSLSNIIAGRYIVVNEDATGFSTVEGGGGEGGKKGEVLIKRSDANFDTTWLDPRTILKKAPTIKETATDVQLLNNCTMILEDTVDTEADDVPHQGLALRQINSDSTADSTCSYVLCDTIDDTAEDDSDVATNEKFGRVKIGEGVNVNNGVISVPVIGLASTEDFGMVRIGSGLDIQDGVVSTQPYPHADSETFGLVKPGSDFYFDSSGALNIVKRNRDIIYQSMATNVVSNGVIEIVPTCAHYRAVVDDDILFSFDWGDFIPDDDVAFELEIISDGTHLIAFDVELNPTMSAIPVNRGTTKISFKKKLGIPYYDIEISRLDAPEPTLLTPNYGDDINSNLMVTHNGSNWNAHDMLKTSTDNMDFWGREFFFEFSTLVVVDYVFCHFKYSDQALGEFWLKASNDKENWTTLLYKNNEIINGNISTEIKGCFRYFKLHLDWKNDNYPRGFQLWGTQIDNNESDLVLLTPLMSSNETGFAKLTYSNLYEGGASQLTDANASTAIYVRYSTDTTDLFRWIKYEFPEAVVANLLDVAATTGNLDRTMRWYKLEGSNDDETWTLLLERQYQRDFTGDEGRWHEFENTTAYKFYKLTCLATNGDQYWLIGRFRLFRREVGKHNFHNLVPTLTSASQDGYEVTASSQYDGGHAPLYAFDGNSATKWASSGTGTQWLQIKLPTVTVCNVVKIVSRSDGDFNNQAPKTFEIQGSNNAETWTTLTSQTNISWTSRGQEQVFSFENESAYLYYRLLITANNGGSDYSLGEFVVGRNIYEYKRYLNSYRRLTPIMTADSQDGFVVTASSIYSGQRVYSSYLAFNNVVSNSDSWSTRSQSGWIQIELPVADKADILKMSGGFSNEEPDSFILYGSNDGTTYTQLLNSGILTWTHNETKTWDLENNTAYKFYKIEAVNTKSSYITISEIQLIEHSITMEY